MRITIFGDTMCQYEYFNKFESISADEYIRSFEETKDVISQSDYVILNLETPVAGEEYGYVKEEFSFNAPIEYALAIKNIGVDMVLCANNHALDRGADGLLATVKNLRKCGLDFIGIHDKKEPSYKIVDVSGLKIGFVNFTYGTNAFANGNYLKRQERFMVDLLQKQELHNKLIRRIYYNNIRYAGRIKKLARKLKIGQFDVEPYERRENDWYEKRNYINSIKKLKKAGADFVIAFPHIGGQYNNEPSDYTKQICDLSIKAGADAVVANHEHVVHPIDKTFLKENKLITYSIGNFLGISGVLRGPFDKKSEYSMGVHIDIDEEKSVKYSFSLYKTVECENILKTFNLYDLINVTDDVFEKEKLISDNNDLIKLILGEDCVTELKKFYEI